MTKTKTITEKEISAGNKLIADFLLTPHHSSLQCAAWKKEIVSNYIDDDYVFFVEEELKFNCSWDWLMPAWSKCKEIGLWMNTNGHDKLWIEKSREIDSAITHEINLFKAFNLIYKLIQWYSKEKKQ